jgi:hypothetical protein
MLWGALGLSIVYGFMFASELERDHMFFLSGIGTSGFLLMIPFISINPLFLHGNYGIQGLKGHAVNSLEFFFSKAINRASIFFVKAGAYLMLSLLPLLVIWAYSYAKPDIRIELPYNTQEHRETTKQFYLSHFTGAYVQKDEQDKEGNKFWVVLPKGQVTCAVFTLVWAFIGTLLFQVIGLGFPPGMRWVCLPTFFAFMLLSNVWGSSLKTPSHYEVGLAWIDQHTPLTLLGLGLLTILSQLYCCRRFVNTEITS